MKINLYFLSIYKKHWINNCTYYKRTKKYHIFCKDDKIYYLDTANNLLLKKVIYNG